MEEPKSGYAKRYKVRKSGDRGLQITILPAWKEQQDVAKGDWIAVYMVGDKLILEHIKRVSI